jgi:predicted PurR-regulated permease PerM
MTPDPARKTAPRRVSFRRSWRAAWSFRWVKPSIGEDAGSGNGSVTAASVVTHVTWETTALTTPVGVPPLGDRRAAIPEPTPTPTPTPEPELDLAEGLSAILPELVGVADQDRASQVPWKTIWATIGIVLATVAAVELFLILLRVIELIIIAGFLAVVLSPAVAGLVRLRLPRGLATAIVFVLGLAALGSLGYLFIHPLYQEAVKLSNNLPDLVAKTQAGKGPLGKLIARYHLQKTASTEIPKLRHAIGNLGKPAMKIAKQVVSGLGGLIAVAVLTYLILLEGPSLLRGLLRSLPGSYPDRARRLVDDVSRSVTGYVLGNVATSFIAGIVCGVTLLILGIPFAIVFGVWVAMVDLLPLVGGLLAGVPTVVFALLHSPTAGIITAIVFLVYQQIENHILNPVIMSRTVKLNPLWVILSVVAGAQLGGIIGALLAIPAAGAIHVVARDVWAERRARRASQGDQPSV